VIAVPDSQARPIAIARTPVRSAASSTSTRGRRAIGHLTRVVIMALLVTALFAVAYWLDSRWPSPEETPRVGDELGGRWPQR
jgi:hypothetical protein